MKIKALSRSVSDYTRERVSGIHLLQSNPDPSIHPFERSREYVRALNATKLEKLFAKPLIGAMDDHSDGVWCMARSPRSLTLFASGSADGEVRIWDLARQQAVWTTYAHQGFVRGMTVSRDGRHLFTCGDDKTIKKWFFGRPTSSSMAAKDGAVRSDVSSAEVGALSFSGTYASRETAAEPLESWIGKNSLTRIDHSHGEDRFITSGSTLELWDYHRSQPIHSFTWGQSIDTITTVAFNPAQHNVVASTASDRSICLYDVRAKTAVRKVILYLKTNSLAWNPQEPFNFATANEDGNAYSFDMRKLSSALVVHKDHVGAVMDVSFSPTGRKIVTGSYDRTIRLWGARSGKSHQVYHTRRMQRVFCVEYSGDGRFVMSGSDDANVRIWKANASESVARLAPRERRKRNYEAKLKKRFAYTKEVRRIARHQHAPRIIKKDQRLEREANEREREKRKRRIAHSKPGTFKRKKTRELPIVKELE